MARPKKTEPKFDKQLKVYVTNEQYQDLVFTANSCGISVSALFQRLADKISVDDYNCKQSALKFLELKELSEEEYDIYTQRHLKRSNQARLMVQNGKLVFHSYEALKAYCDDVNNPLDKVVLGEDVTSLRKLFFRSSRTNEQFKGIADWDVSNVTDMHGMFCGTKDFNQPIGNWNVSNVTNMAYMFYGAVNFNQPLNNWDVSKVEDMSFMFYCAKKFNQPLDNWNVSNVTNMFCMFSFTEDFNQPLNNWDVSNVKSMVCMFLVAKKFNHPLDNWDLSNKPSGAEELEHFRQSKGQVVEQKESKVKSVHK